jgi:hypothetical protein
MSSNSKSEGRDFVYVGTDDIYFCLAGQRLSDRYTNEEDGKTLRRCWTRRIDGSDPRVRRVPRTWSHRPTISVRVLNNLVIRDVWAISGYRIFPEMQACL